MFAWSREFTLQACLSRYDKGTATGTLMSHGSQITAFTYKDREREQRERKQQRQTREYFFSRLTELATGPRVSKVHVLLDFEVVGVDYDKVVVSLDCGANRGVKLDCNVILLLHQCLRSVCNWYTASFLTNYLHDHSTYQSITITQLC